ncbi:helix-turn-helix domain-containing protein [Sphingobium chungbukense]|uniref:HTH cro/C1-type domain-containing protein n=1 Tax=Sphingobium chungbukense TaxID=56193 RepID=A0A0M3ATH6_9SPHN|nr:transcriptional regulator [Sphingobium chungbukense]KKW92236.1 hypothetical protein YP76_09875 [Sphingobium chungbukense]
MTPDELKNIRKGLGWTQMDMAMALDMSRKAVVEMEGGKAAIEHRTGLAVLYLAEHPEVLTERRALLQEFAQRVGIEQAMAAQGKTRGRIG